LLLWDIAADKERFPLPGAALPAVWDARGGVLATASASDSGDVRLWDMASGKALTPLSGHDERVTALAFSSDGKLLASASADRTVRLWDLKTGEQRSVLRGLSGPVNSVKFTPDGKTLIAAAGDTEKYALWDVTTGKRYYFRQGMGAFTAVALTQDGKRVATACGPDVHLWDASGEKPAVALEGPGGVVTALAFDERGKTLTAWSNLARKQWDAGTREGLATETLREEGRALPRVEGSADGKTLSSRQGHTLSLRDLRSGEKRGVIEHVRHQPVFSPDGSLCAVEMADPVKGGPADGPHQRVALKLWEVVRGKETATFADVRGPVVFSPDSRLVAAVALAAAPKGGAGLPADRSPAGIKVWEVRTGKEAAHLDGAFAPI